MAKHSYRIASQEGADRYGTELGGETELDLSVSERRAVLAAGWVEQLDEEDEASKPKGGK